MNHKPPPRPKVCTHRTYLLTCDDYDELVADHDGRCAICRLSGPETGHGFLCIDHDPPVGQWAVRGLLCSPCNGRISPDSASTPEDAAYLADPWHVRWLARRGLSGTVPPEPAMGATVFYFTRRPNPRTWRRTRRGWVCSARDAGWGYCMSWQRLNQRYGPHNLHLAA